MYRLFVIAVFAACFVFSSPGYSEPKASPELVVHLLDYLAKDYGGAVKDGKILSQSEYDEQIEFAHIVQTTTEQNEDLKSDQDFINGVSKLGVIIKSKGSAEEVSKLARKLQQDAIRLARIEVSPRTFPNLNVGAKLFQNNCTSCHGEKGHGDGIAGANLDPKPANFHDPDLVWGSSPFKFYNTIRLGVPGTGMAAFSHLTDEEVWSLAFYLKTFPYQDKPDSVAATSFSIKELASMTDEELAEKLGGKNDKSQATIASVRKSSRGPTSGDALQLAEQLLKDSLVKAQDKNYIEAGSLAIRAYLEGIEPLEPKMKANIPGFVEQLESLMSQYRSALERSENPENLKPQVEAIIGKLDEARTVFSQTKMSPGVAFGAAFSIFLREGFEAVLIIVVLISILKAMGQPQAIRWVHVGWIAAVGVGVVSWFASGLLLSMSGMSRELLEGLISLFAVAVLLYVGFWLHRYSEMKKWRAFLESRLRHGLTSGSYVLLALVSFMAVFREAFEVVLFLRAIWIDLDSGGQSVAGLGVLSSLIILSVLAWVAIKESRRLPLGLLFQICSWTMIGLAFILAGKGTHSLQEAGLISISSFPINLRIDLIGLFPTYETLLTQFALTMLFTALLLLDRKPSPVQA